MARETSATHGRGEPWGAPGWFPRFLVGIVFACWDAMEPWLCCWLVGTPGLLEVTKLCRACSPQPPGAVGVLEDFKGLAPVVQAPLLGSDKCPPQLATKPSLSITTA